MATYYVDFDLGSGLNDGTSWANAFRTESALWTTATGGINNAAAGDIYYISNASTDITLTANRGATTVDGTPLLPITIIGVKNGTTAEPPAYSDWATAAADRPTFVAGAYELGFGETWKIMNIEVTCANGNNYGLQTGRESHVVNVKVSRSGGSASTYCFYSYESGSTAWVNCEAQGANNGYGTGFAPQSSGRVIFCYAYDLENGVYAANTGLVVIGSIFDNCAAGINITDEAFATIINNTIHDCEEGIGATTGYSNTIINNIVNDCTRGDADGANWTTQYDSNFWWKNNFEGNTTNFVNVASSGTHSDLELDTNDPQFTDVNNDDFSLQSGSACRDAGMTISLGVG